VRLCGRRAVVDKAQNVERARYERLFKPARVVLADEAHVHTTLEQRPPEVGRNRAETCCGQITEEQQLHAGTISPSASPTR
jgi:hypothetical protein